MRVLVTGGAGFIGSRLVALIEKEADWQVTVFDNLTTGHISNLSGSTNLVVGDVRSKDEVESVVEDKDILFHFAALTSTQESLRDPISYIETNSIGTLNLLDAAVKGRIKKFVFASSSAVYGFVDNVTREDISYNPSNPYALSKVHAELSVQYYGGKGLKFTILRFFNVFGERQSADSEYASVIPVFIKKALKNEPLPIYGDGEQTRDFVYVEDVARASFLAASTGGIFNVGAEKEYSINQLAKMVIRLTDSHSKIVYKPAREGDDRRSIANIERIQKSLSWQPQNELEDNLQKVIEWYRIEGFKYEW